MGKISLLLLLGALGCNSISTKPNQLKELPDGTKLYVNTQQKQKGNFYHPDNKHYLVRKTREEGEKDLEELVKNSDVEEAWIFHPVYDLWVEVGTEESLCSVKFKKALVDREVIFYHIHPKKATFYSRLLYEVSKKAYEKLEVEIEKETSKEYYSLKNGINLALANQSIKRAKFDAQSSMILSGAMPSPADIGIAARYGTINCIASEKGMTDFLYLGDLDKVDIEKLEKRYNDIGLKEIGVKYLKNGFGEIDTIQNTMKELNEKFDGELRLVFRPWPKPMEISRH